MKKHYLIFIVVAFLMNIFLYLYPADIFQTESINSVIKDATVKQLLDSNNLSQFSNLTIKGWFMLIICTVGIPAIIAWRSTLTKYSRKTGEQQNSIYDKLK
jgi:hypothetical protein